MHFFRFVLLLALFGFGCKGAPKPDDLPKLHPVGLTITQDGKPLADANVLMMAESEGDKWSPGGITDASGFVAPKTHGRYDGAPAGKYKVCVSKSEIEPLSPADSDAGKRPKVFKLVEDRYGGPDTTPLEMEVVPGKNVQTFDVGKSVRIPVPNDGP